ncbi:fimbrial protein [Pseudomonas protegens]|uniref:fimbrial protein n=1 Tax=Pseudomonas protegens TaxID=380021 RepID=UPI00366D22E8
MISYLGGYSFFRSYLVIFFVCVIYSGFVSADYRNNYCNSGAELGSNSISFKLGYLRPFSEVEVGGVLGTAALVGAVTCNDVEEPYGKLGFSLQVGPGTGEPGDICSTPIDGVGVRYRSAYGRAIPCDHWDEVFLVRPKKGGYYAVSLDQAVEFIKTKPRTSLGPGLHELRLPPSSYISSYWKGTTNSNIWGNYAFYSTAKLLVADCRMVDANKTVDFEGVNPYHLADGGMVEKKFDLTLGSCGSQSAAEEFNSVASFHFQSKNIRTDGRLENDRCEGCAKGILITVANAKGKMIDLNKSYLMRGGDYSLSGERITHHFLARLERDFKNIEAGRIQVVLTLIISSL